MVHWLLRSLARLMPAIIPAVFLIVVFATFFSQNRTIFVQDGDFKIVSDEDVMEKFPTHIAGEEGRFDARQTFPRTAIVTSVAKKFILTRRAGFGLLDRGHNSTFTAEIPEFLDDSSFHRQLGEQLRRDYEQAANEFAATDWSLVIEGLQSDRHYLRNWERTIFLDFVHSTSCSVSLLESHWEYTGGAHGNHHLAGRNFIETQGQIRELRLEDLFDPSTEWSKRLISICVSELRCQGATSIPDISVEDVDSSRFTVEDLTSFTVSSNGLRFYFSPYHVGCYAEGVYTVNVPFSSVCDCIPESSPARFFMAVNCR